MRSRRCCRPCRAGRRVNVLFQLGYPGRSARHGSRFPNLTLGITGGSDNSNVRNVGPQITLELPVFRPEPGRRRDRDCNPPATARSETYPTQLATATGQVKAMVGGGRSAENHQLQDVRRQSGMRIFLLQAEAALQRGQSRRAQLCRPGWCPPHQGAGRCDNRAIRCWTSRWPWPPGTHTACRLLRCRRRMLRDDIFSCCPRNNSQFACKSTPRVAVETEQPREETVPDLLVAYGSAMPALGGGMTLSFPQDIQVPAIPVTPGETGPPHGDRLLDFAASAAAVSAYQQAVTAVTAARQQRAHAAQLLGQQLATRDQLAQADKAVADAEVSLDAFSTRGRR